MGNFIKQQEEKKEVKEKDKTRRERLAGYFFDLSKLVFAALVLGGITPLFTNEPNKMNGLQSYWVFSLPIYWQILQIEF